MTKNIYKYIKIYKSKKEVIKQYRLFDYKNNHYLVVVIKKPTE